MRRSLAVALLSAFATLVVPVAPAQAGGPTSVIITDPSSGRATALYYTSDEYVELERLVQASEPADAPPSDSLGGTAYTVTWLIHDVMIWRTDFIRVGAPGGPYVETRLLGGDEVMGERSTWARATQGKALATLLERALDGRSAPAPSEPSTPRASAPEAADTPPPAAEPVTRWYSLSGWRWAVVGLLAGLLAGVLVARRQPSARSQRQVLEDRVSERV